MREIVLHGIAHKDHLVEQHSILVFLVHHFPVREQKLLHQMILGVQAELHHGHQKTGILLTTGNVVDQHLQRFDLENNTQKRADKDTTTDEQLTAGKPSPAVRLMCVCCGVLCDLNFFILLFELLHELGFLGKLQLQRGFIAHQQAARSLQTRGVGRHGDGDAHSRGKVADTRRIGCSPRWTRSDEAAVRQTAWRVGPRARG
jgi:hypothetical protein